MNLVNKKYVILIQIGQNCCQISRTLNGRSGGDLNIHIQFIGDNACQCRLAESRWAIEQDMIQWLISELRCLYKYFQILLNTLLSDVILQVLRPQTGFLPRFTGIHTGRCNSLILHIWFPRFCFRPLYAAPASGSESE